MVSANDLDRSKGAISNGLWFVAHNKESDPEATQIRLLTAILTELVAAREDRVIARSGPKLKIGG